MNSFVHDVERRPRKPLKLKEERQKNNYERRGSGKLIELNTKDERSERRRRKRKNEGEERKNNDREFNHLLVDNR